MLFLTSSPDTELPHRAVLCASYAFFQTKKLDPSRCTVKSEFPGESLVATLAQTQASGGSF